MSQLKTLAELVRLPNVFSAVADIVLGFGMLAAISGGGDWRVLSVGIAVTICLYWAGMVLNDFFDAEIDAIERKARPIPSGRVSRKSAGMLGFGLLVAGVLIAWLWTVLSGTALPGIVATALAACVLSYDGGLKRTLAGFLAMGACRFFNVLLGAALAADGGGISANVVEWFPQAVWLAAGGIGLYVAGVTLFAKTEAVTSARGQLVIAGIIMLGGLALVALIPTTPDLPDKMPVTWWPVMGIVGLFVGWIVAPAIGNPSPQRVQPTVGRLLRLLIFLDALAVMPASVTASVAIILLLIPAMLTGRWVYST